jgi:hypothetical protein
MKTPDRLIEELAAIRQAAGLDTDKTPAELEQESDIRIGLTDPADGEPNREPPYYDHTIGRIITRTSEES